MTQHYSNPERESDPHAITAADIQRDAAIALPNGWTARVETEHDDDAEPPWEQCEGHGSVSDWQSYDDLESWEVPWIVNRDGRSCRVYDHDEALREARREWWGCPHVQNGESFEHTLGGHESRELMFECAVQSDFEFLRRWCADEWEYLCIDVTLYDAEGVEVERDSLCGVESDGGYWKEQAAEMINGLAEGLVMPNARGNPASEPCDTSEAK